MEEYKHYLRAYALARKGESVDFIFGSADRYAEGRHELLPDKVDRDLALCCYVAATLGVADASDHASLDCLAQLRARVNAYLTDPK